MYKYPIKYGLILNFIFLIHKYKMLLTQQLRGNDFKRDQQKFVRIFKRRT